MQPPSRSGDTTRNVTADAPETPPATSAPAESAPGDGVSAPEPAPPGAAHGDAPPSLERALAKTEADAEATLKAAAAMTAALRRVRHAAHAGTVRDLRPAFDSAEQALAALRQTLANAKLGWDFDEETHLASGAYARELLDVAERMGLRLFEQDDRLYAYPALVRVLPNDRTVLIDKTRERRLRPSVLVAHLKELQRRPPRFRPEAFLEALFGAYSTLVDAAAGRRRDALGGQGTVVRLLDVYTLLTLLPGQSRDYSRQEFARDVYLLDQSGTRTTRRGATVAFPASTGTRSQASVIRVITQSGQEKLYYGIAFHNGA